MRRRSLLVAAAAGLPGCLAARSSTGSTSSSTASATASAAPSRRTAEGLAATLRVVDGHAPTDDTATATFGADRVIVTGTMDPSGCDRPVLTGVGYDPDDGTVRMVVGGESPYGTAEVECGNASFDYRCVLSVDRGRPAVVAVVHDYGGETERFTLERGE